MTSRLETLEQENKKLKLRVDQVERENRELKRSLYELSARHSHVFAELRRVDGYTFDVDALLASLAEVDADELEHAETVYESAKGASPPSKLAAGARHGASGAGGGRDAGEPSLFHYKYDLQGHGGSVYMVRFAPSGQLIASGGFDKTVRVWDIERPARQEEVLCLSDHSLHVSDVAWSSDSTTLVSGSFDHTVKAWSVAQGQLLGTWRVPTGAFVQKVAFQPGMESQVVLVSTTHRQILAYDRREGTMAAPAFALENDCMVNTLCCYHDGVHVLSGDKHGQLKTWDLRMRQAVDTICNGEQGKPVSHIELSLRVDVVERDTVDDGRFVAVNSYDNVLRVYERAHNSGRLEALHALKGHHNKNWPIRSSFYVGKNYHRSRPMQRRLASDVGAGANATSGSAACGVVGGNGAGAALDPMESMGVPQGVPMGPDVAEERGARPVDEGSGRLSVHDTMLLATGSADSRAYIFDVGGARPKLVQRLEGHSDRVHAVSFHPQDPLLATCSADFSIKIWGAKMDRYRGG